MRLQHPVPRAEWPLAPVLVAWLLLGLGPSALIQRAASPFRHSVAALSGAASALLLSRLAGVGPPRSWPELAGILAAVALGTALLALSARRAPSLSAGGGILLLCTLNLALLGAPRPSASVALAAPAPDILLLTLDTLRADAVSASPGALVPGLTPQLDALAAQGCLAPAASASAPLTGPSHAALLSGQPPQGLGLLLNGRTLPTDMPWLPETLQNRGYRTVAAVSSAMVAGDLGYDRGFEVFDDDLDGGAWLRHSIAGRLQPPQRRARQARFDRRGADTIARLDAILAKDDDRPLFVWLHLYDAHRPYRPGPAALARVPELIPGLPDPDAYADHPALSAAAHDGPGQAAPLNFTRQLFDDFGRGPGATRDPARAARAYLAGVHELDGRVGQALDAWRARRGGLPPVWAVVADHGESLTEHGEIGSHQQHLYEANLRVPLLLSTGDCPAGPVSTRGLAGSLLAATGTPDPAFAQLKDALPVEATVLGRRHGPGPGRVPKTALRVGDQKVLVLGRGSADALQHEAYDLAQDPHEIRPLGILPAELLGAADLAHGAIQQGRPAQELDRAAREALEALGYVE